MELNEGDKVQYVGSDPKLQQGYSGKELVIHAVDESAQTVDCIEKHGDWVSGVPPHDLQPLPNADKEPPQQRIQHLNDEHLDEYVDDVM